MKLKYIVVMAIISMLTYGFTNKKRAENNNNQPEQMNIIKDSLLRHVVLFKFKDDTSKEDIKKVEDAFNALPSKIKQITGYEWGTNNSPEGLDKGFTHCFFLTFKSEADRAIYLPHPDHKAFGDVLGPHLDDVLVLDYWTK
ncbi:Dabb family protein [Maribacter sp. CXY002]|uniref:Dabb family protein n=1 Tax=Maribacter luteocoastalis TaxID=3407671 RepID=UPI003B66C9F0